MMKRTRVCDLLGIEHPIIQGGMLWLATAELASAVSNAGGLGVISPFAGMEKNGDPLKNLKLQIAKVRDRTEKPFGVNIPLYLQQSGILIDVVLKEEVRVVITSGGDPGHFTELLHQVGMKVLHVVSTVGQAQKAESCKMDALIVEGVEAAAYVGFDEVPLFSLIPQVADVVSIPIIAAGGIVDGRGVVAAFALGAEGVQLGTRFVAVEENIANPKCKQAIIEAKDTDTVITCRKLLPTRSLKTELTRRLLELEASGASIEEIRDFLGTSRARKGQIEGDLVNGEAYCGSSAGLIKEILPAATVVQRLVDGFQEIVKKMAEVIEVDQHQF
jgi:enoyl-[acyl-carrier protein] reductase II